MQWIYKGFNIYPSFKLIVGQRDETPPLEYDLEYIPDKRNCASKLASNLNFMDKLVCQVLTVVSSVCPVKSRQTIFTSLGKVVIERRSGVDQNNGH
jgi:hypothetical protein